jgi:hypothetical protein
MCLELQSVNPFHEGNGVCKSELNVLEEAVISRACNIARTTELVVSLDTHAVEAWLQFYINTE